MSEVDNAWDRYMAIIRKAEAKCKKAIKKQTEKFIDKESQGIFPNLSFSLWLASLRALFSRSKSA